MNQGVTMRRLALTDDILMKIEKPARYIGNEVNSVMKDKTDVDIRFAMCFKRALIMCTKYQKRALLIFYRYW